MRLEIKDFETRLIVPISFRGSAEKIIERYKNWLDKKFALLNEVKELSKKLGVYDHENLEEMVREYINEASSVLKVKPKKVSFRYMKRRWGSCSKEGHIILNKKLKFLPSELIRYVVFHEMCHLLVHNHKKEFWLLVKNLCPNFKECEKLLAGYQLKIN